MISSPASGLPSRLASILCCVAALLCAGTPGLAAGSNPQIPTCNADAGSIRSAVGAQAAEGRDLRGGVDAMPGCLWLTVPEPFPLALLGLGLVAVALTRRRPRRQPGQADRPSTPRTEDAQARAGKPRTPSAAPEHGDTITIRRGVRNGVTLRNTLKETPCQV